MGTGPSPHPQAGKGQGDLGGQRDELRGGLHPPSQDGAPGDSTRSLATRSQAGAQPPGCRRKTTPHSAQERKGPLLTPHSPPPPPLRRPQPQTTGSLPSLPSACKGLRRQLWATSSSLCPRCSSSEACVRLHPVLLPALPPQRPSPRVGCFLPIQCQLRAPSTDKPGGPARWLHLPPLPQLVPLRPTAPSQRRT